jgi:hypothetical protein
MPWLNNGQSNNKPHTHMKSEYITNDIAIIVGTIVRHTTTADFDRDGYLLNSGVNRTLCTAVSTKGELIIYAETNGDPVVLFEGHEVDFVRLISDQEDDDWDNVESGISRLKSLAIKLAHDDETDADWLRDRIEWAIASL